MLSPSYAVHYSPRRGWLIWRQVEVPTSITLKGLYDVVQAALGWFDYHLWQFTIGERRYGLPGGDIAKVKEECMNDKARRRRDGAHIPKYFAYDLVRVKAMEARDHYRLGAHDYRPEPRDFWTTY